MPPPCAIKVKQSRKTCFTLRHGSRGRAKQVPIPIGIGERKAMMTDLAEKLRAEPLPMLRTELQELLAQAVELLARYQPKSAGVTAWLEAVQQRVEQGSSLTGSEGGPAPPAKE